MSVGQRHDNAHLGALARAEMTSIVPPLVADPRGDAGEAKPGHGGEVGDLKALIEGTVDKVKEGSDLVTETASAFSQVAGSTGKVKELVAEIAAASSEQAQGVDQISRAVTDMSNITQQTAANAEESASAAQELTAQSGQMKGVVGDLVALVAGRAHGSNGRLSGPARPAALKTRPATVGQPSGRGKGLAASRSLTPEQIIPLEDADFKDF